MNNSKRFKALVVILLFVDLVFAGKHLGAMSYDEELFKSWTVYILNHGLGNTYAIGNNDYMPYFQYTLYLLSKLAGSEQAILANFAYLKGFILFFDFLGLWYVYKWIDKKVEYLILLLISILNIAFSYNTLLWGQIDGAYCALAFIAVYYAFKNKTVLSFLFFVLALNVKIQAIVIAPVLGLIYLFRLIENKQIMPFVYAILVAAVAEVIILIPFIGNPNGLPLLWKEIATSMGRYPWLGDNNFWTFIHPHNTWEISDAGMFIFGITYKNAGLIIFSIASFAALWPTIRVVFMKIKKLPVALPQKEIIWLTCCLMALQFYFFNTEMHERYSHLTLLFITAYAFYSRNYLPYILYCFLYFIILERGIKWLALPSYDTLIFNSLFIASMFAVLIVYLYYKLYKLAYAKPALNNP